MFERFTSEARRTIVLAQEEARRLQHNYIGTEHLLLGLLAEQNGVAARAADRIGLTLAIARDDVVATIGTGKKAPSGHIPFTPRAKKCLELSLREALALQHEYIGTEHILLGIMREGEGVAAVILSKHAGNLTTLRAAVLDLVPTASASPTHRWLRRRASTSTSTLAGPGPLEPDEAPELRTTPAADTSLAEAARLAGPNPVGSHHLLLAALADPKTAASRALAGLGLDLDRARQVLRDADVIGSTDELADEAGRRQMLIRVDQDRLTIEAADPAIVKLGLAAIDALDASARGSRPPSADTGPGQVKQASPDAAAGPDAGAGPDAAADPGAGAGRGGVIRGDQAAGAGLGMVWQSLHDSLEDIRRRALVAADLPPRTTPETAEEADTGTG